MIQTTRPTDYFDLISKALSSVQVSAAGKNAASDISLDEGVGRVLDFVSSAKAGFKKIMLIGNGGSASIVSHIQNDLCDSAAVRAIVFNEAPFLTAIANDHGYETFFETAVQLWSEPGDMLLAISSSGRSQNIIRAVHACQEKGNKVITLSGFSPDNPLRKLGDVNFYVPSKSYGIVECSHSILGHYLTDCICELQKAI